MCNTDLLEPSWSPLGPILGPSWALLGALGLLFLVLFLVLVFVLFLVLFLCRFPFSLLLSFLLSLSLSLSLSRSLSLSLSLSLAVFGLFSVLGPSLASWAPLGPLLGPSWANLADLGPFLGGAEGPKTLKNLGFFNVFIISTFSSADRLRSPRNRRDNKNIKKPKVF